MNKLNNSIVQRTNIFLSLDQQLYTGYFNPQDPAPIYKRQLSHEFEQYIMNCIRPVRRETTFLYKISYTCDVDKQYAEPLLFAIRRHFAEKKKVVYSSFEKFKRRTYLLLFMMMYYYIWWFIGALAMAMGLVAYRFYAVRLEAIEVRNETLQEQLEQLTAQLDYSILKEMKMDKEAKQVKQTKQQLLNVINHEIRTLMNGIMGMSTLLVNTPLNTEQKEYADTI